MHIPTSGRGFGIWLAVIAVISAGCGVASAEVVAGISKQYKTAVAIKATTANSRTRVIAIAKASPAASGQVLGASTQATKVNTGATSTPMPNTITPQYIGMFVTSSPNDPASRTVIDAVAATGCNLVYNYTAFDGTPAQVEAYLNYAGSKGIKVIIGLQDLYDQLPNGAQTAQTYAQYGSTNDAIATTVVRDFQANPAVWGFSITDERPESATDLGTWQPILASRYAAIKQLTAKPVMAVLEGWSDGNASGRQELFQGVAGSADALALDYYPVPFMPLARIGTIMNEAAPYKGGWFIEQVFSWSSYPDVIQGLGYNPSEARPPSAAEMVAMGRDALAGGARNLLLYSYFDIASNPGQLDLVRQAVQELKN